MNGSLAEQKDLSAMQPVPSAVTTSRLRQTYAIRASICMIVTCIYVISSVSPISFSNFNNDQSGNKSSIDWRPCFDNQDVLCATLSVPTNHDQPAEGTTYLSMAKVPSLGEPKEKLGTIYTNPGGPGGSGRSFCLNSGAMLRDLVGGKFDVVCWDPRGIGRTLPNVNCHGSALEQSLFLGQSVLKRTFEVPPADLHNNVSRASLIAQQNQALREMQVQADLCGNNVGAETLKWMGTTTLIRDIEYIKNTIEGEDALINFHGGSYGTIVADYLANMLPDKVGKVIAYGVADPPRWATHHYEDYTLLGKLLLDAEVTYQKWLDTVVANSELNRFAHSGKELGKKLDQMFVDLWETGGVSIASAAVRGVFTSGMLRETLFATIQQPQIWRSTVSGLVAALDGDYLPIFSILHGPIDVGKPKPEADGYVSIGQRELSRLAVSCADAPPYANKSTWPAASDMVDRLIQHSASVSSHFGLTVNLMEQHGGCQFWPQSDRPAPRFTGPWNHTLRTPMLVVSNKFDPITPAAEGEKMATRLRGSARHLVQNRIGHSYTVKPTDCYRRVAQKYFEEGVLPDEDVFCDADDGWYPEHDLSKELMMSTLELSLAP